jgi:hypothetical protein
METINDIFQEKSRQYCRRNRWPTIALIVVLALSLLAVLSRGFD